MAKSAALRRAALRRGSVLALAAVLATSGCAAGRDAQTANQVATQDGTDASVGSIALRGLALEAPQGSEYYAPGQGIPIRLVLVNNGQRGDQLTNIVTTKARGWAAFPTQAQAEQVLAAGQSRRQPGSSGPSASTSGSGSATGAPSSTDSSPTGPSDTAAPDTNAATSPAGSTSPGGSTSASGSPSASRTQTSLPTGLTTVTIPAGRRVSWGVPDSDLGLLLLSATDRIYPGTSIKITFTFARAGSVTVTVPVQLSAQPGDLTVAPVSAANEGN